MFQRCLLTIYEPEKDPRVVELQVSPPNSEENDMSVYNEDGTILKDYQLYVETADNRLIKAPRSNDESTKKWNTLKFWKRWKSEMNGVGESNSVVSDVPVSENTHNFLKKYKINSTKKEKKIARMKDIRNVIAQKKMKNKLRRQRKREMKKLLFSQLSSNEDLTLPVTFVPSGNDVHVENEKDGRNSKRKLPSLLDTKIEFPPKVKKRITFEPSENDIHVDNKNDVGNSKSKLPSLLDAKIEFPSRVKKRKNRLSKKQKKRNLAVQNSNEDSVTGSDNLEIEMPNSSSSRIGSSSNHGPKVKDDEPKLRWKASEPAADFIPIGTSDQSINESNSDIRYGKFRNSINPNPRSYDFMGISQKAFFLQC